CGKPLLREIRNPVRELVVGECSLPAKFVKVGVELLVERANAAGPDRSVRQLYPLEACKPHSIGDEQMIERAVNRLEERPLVPLTRFITQRGCKTVEVVVHPT